MFKKYEIGVDHNDVMAAVKTSAATLLEKLSGLVEADPDAGSYYLGLRLGSIDKSGLMHGLVILTDRRFDGDAQAAYQHAYGGLTRYYCSDSITCIIIEELDRGNFNVKTLTWDDTGGVCRISEEGAAAQTREEIMLLFGVRGQTTRDMVAQRFGVASVGFLLDEEKIANPKDVSNFFGEAIRTYESNELVP